MIYPLSWEFSWPYILSAFVGAYLIGSVPFGLLLTRLSGLGDIRAIGSGNIGATNVLRTGHKALAAATLLLDVVKAAAAVLIAKQYGPDMAIVAAAGVMIGQVFFRLGVDIPDHAEIAVGIDRSVLGRQIAHVAIAGQHGEVLAKVLVDCLGLGRGFYDNNVHESAVSKP